MKDPHDIIVRPVLTEKAYDGIADKRYIFEVPVNATKTEIKMAVEKVFADDDVKVDKVNTVRTLGKIKRQGLHSGRTPEVKKAYVTLKKDSKPIKFFEGMAQ
jgi:large subunit ribosomal protein L23